jgi:hypothetical protein
LSSPSGCQSTPSPKSVPVPAPDGVASKRRHRHIIFDDSNAVGREVRKAALDQVDDLDIVVRKAVASSLVGLPLIDERLHS